MPASPHRASWWLMRPRVQRNWGSKAVWLSCSIRAWLMQSFRLPLASQKGMLGKAYQPDNQHQAVAAEYAD